MGTSPTTLLWRGAANYQIDHQGLTTLIDPLFTRLPGDRPHLVDSCDCRAGIDVLLLTHGHLDHSLDVPYLANKHHPEAYGPAACLADVLSAPSVSAKRFDPRQWHALETVKGTSFAELREHDHVDVLAIPYCPANGHWLQDTQFLVQRFAPKVTLVHHFDNFAHPYTLSNYMNLSDYQQALRGTCPDARFFFSKFATKVELSQIVASNG